MNILPSEILLYIYDFLDQDSQLQFIRTCKYCENLFNLSYTIIKTYYLNLFICRNKIIYQSLENPVRYLSIAFNNCHDIDSYNLKGSFDDIYSTLSQFDFDDIIFFHDFILDDYYSYNISTRYERYYLYIFQFYNSNISCIYSQFISNRSQNNINIHYPIIYKNRYKYSYYKSSDYTFRI